jgi:Uncharacterized membrane protein (homolog of Drosophila rhomboid)
MNQQFNPTGFNILPPVVKNLLIINVLCFFAMLTLQRFGIDLNDILGLHFLLASDFRPYQLVTYMFMHGNFVHIFFNMFALWMFGNTLENIWGPKRFLIFYFICGIGAGLTQELVQYIQYASTLAQYDNVNTGEAIIPMAEYLNMMTTVGASGAIYGILLAFGMMFPDSLIYIYFAIPIKAKWFVLIYGAIELFSGLTGAGGNVAHFAHLGGMVFGYFLILFWKKKGRLF